ncbi:MAG: pyruvate kinase [Rhodospirillaceae bacterium]|jgi:pyruvate kinase|nr:pyruvate kinase [Rhodospirillaceae bacterium]MBT5245475.1 pyruvate kinase [Rhodospirillaceae bacterium]MBT5560957.1 pyruvate kinase [Rhodospirillaceae bacterium]MBT6240593.1 pyruvate kinase [Rhodospirillaceae bacterium]MBT7137942.1 pyruvate kinase [Rhodospirillaceae bacterium]
MRRRRNAKIIATLGPGTSDEKSINDLFLAGVDVFRLNFSHGAHEEHKARFDTIRALEKKHERPIGVLLDLQGPKLRLGVFEDGKAVLRAGNPFRLELAEIQGNDVGASLPHPEIFAALKPEMKLLLDDGKIELKVHKCGKDFAETMVVTGGEISDRKGVNVPSAMLDLSPITEKDHGDLQYGLELGVDWVALSFVQRPEDIVEAKKLVDGRAGVMAKLEKPSAIDYLDEIVDLADAVMVARGDLGVELPPEDVPAIQKQILYSCRCAGKPVVVATQMLESMIHTPTPTRAEASDVATAIYDGADAVMLSAETAVGEYPIETVSMMDRIINRVEVDPLYRKITDSERREAENTANDAITAAARQSAQIISAAAIVTFSSSGSTTLRASRERPTVSILGLTPKWETARRMTLVWGVHSVLTPDLTSFTEMVNLAIESAKHEEFASTGDSLVVTAGVPFGTPGATNILRIAKIS